ncbi:alkylhydroperoxidase domain protein [Rothia terrae]|uniref:alkylhydroperoxidase domain protein n=1 Tax=Rothia terrae TaxID=396015 RepID=UPI00288194BD|nr:alkylhydroperoxidase domain protein [Rothia terrae]MDT0189885.1 alkylhydroperoxidase domain protein [Rothia terrae]
MADIIDILSEIPDNLRSVRRMRQDAVDNAQKSFELLVEGESSLTPAERFAVAAEVACLHQVEKATTFYQEIAAEEQASGERLDAILAATRVITLAPAQADARVLSQVRQYLTKDEVVTLYQLISFLAFQLRVVLGLQVLAGGASGSGLVDEHVAVDHLTVGDNVRTYPDLVGPTTFVRHSLGWKPWVAPLEKNELTDEHREALVSKDREGSEYFRLLVRDPGALRARTLTDFDIFYNVDGGLGRAERELAATAASKVNGCIYCASVHSVRGAKESDRGEDFDALLADVNADVGSTEWSAIRDAAVALTQMTFSYKHVDALRAEGFDDASIIDVINASAFFNWANRLMLTLGEPELPQRFR